MGGIRDVGSDLLSVDDDSLSCIMEYPLTDLTLLTAILFMAGRNSVRICMLASLIV
jgi:hypothetical protein